MREIKASEFKAKCLKLIDEVAETGEAIVITKRGKAVVRVERDRAGKKPSLFGCMKGLITQADPDDNLFSAMTAEDLAAMDERQERRAALLDSLPRAKRRRR